MEDKRISEELTVEDPEISLTDSEKEEEEEPIVEAGEGESDGESEVGISEAEQCSDEEQVNGTEGAVDCSGSGEVVKSRELEIIEPKNLPFFDDNSAPLSWPWIVKRFEMAAEVGGCCNLKCVPEANIVAAVDESQSDAAASIATVPLASPAAGILASFNENPSGAAACRLDYPEAFASVALDEISSDAAAVVSSAVPDFDPSAAQADASILVPSFDPDNPFSVLVAANEMKYDLCIHFGMDPAGAEMAAHAIMFFKLSGNLYACDVANFLQGINEQHLKGSLSDDDMATIFGREDDD